MKKDYEKLSYDILKTIPFFMKSIMHDFHKKECCHGLNPTQRKTLILIHHSSNITITDLGKRMNLEKGSFSSVVDSLLIKKLIIKNQDSTDKRKYFLQLTIEGNKAVSEIEKAFEDHIENLFKSFSQKQFTKISEAIETLNTTAQKLQEKQIER